jgi:hypothetical protein
MLNSYWVGIGERLPFEYTGSSNQTVLVAPDVMDKVAVEGQKSVFQNRKEL